MTDVIINDAIVDDALRDIIDNLVAGIDNEEFSMLYKTLPFNYYFAIEKLSYSRSQEHKDICDKAREITNKFHKNI